ncbi:MAG: outer membrane protein assembly factor BamA [Kiloniellales bacterium]|nr:outer membrane protein assembly factor BamA [Kiloniellales bacterium]
MARNAAFGLALLLIAASLLTSSESVVAQSIFAGGTIEEIRIEGSQRIEPASVRSYMGVNPGDTFDAVKLDRGLKALFDTGLFADVTFRREGNTLVVSIVENPIINRLAFEGNRRIDDETLQAETELRPRIVYTRTKVQNDVKRILDIYRRSGRFAAVVEPKVIQLEQNRVDLVFEIDEGPTTGIKSINFIGNREFSDGTLRGEIVTQETAFWRIFSATDTYDPDRLSFDRELLRRFYLREGFADFRVVSAIAELTPDREGFILTFTVEEGEQYTFGKIDVITSLRNLDPNALRSRVVTEEGDTYNADEIEESITSLTEAVGDLGYAFVDIRPRVDKDVENRIINLTYDIQEGPKVFVERIEIEGNERTLDKVIRREFRLVEGDAFNATKLRRSRQRVQDLGFFRSVTVDTEEGSQDDRSVVRVAVEEQPTGDLTFGAGFSTTVGPVGNIAIRERNLLGRGQDLRLSFTLSGDRSELDLSFTEPYFLDKDLSAGFDAFRVQQDQDESSFNETVTGGGVRIGYDLFEDVRQVWRYTGKYQQVQDVDNDASELVKDQEGNRIVSSMSQELIWNRLDSRLNPSDGYAISLTTEVAGLGGDAFFSKNSIKGAYYYPVFDDVILSVTAIGGYMIGLGKDTQVSDRFFIGGSTFRGFEFAGIGPRDADTDDALGGNYYYVGTAEATFPLGLPEEFQIKGRLFAEVGALWDLDNNDVDVNVDDSSSPRLTLGAGISWNSPLGPFVVDFGIPLIKEDFDEEEIFRFSVGTRF